MEKSPEDKIEENVAETIQQKQTDVIELEISSENQKKICKEETEGKIRFYEWDEKYQNEALAIVNADETQASETNYDKLEKNAKRNWDIFYKNNKTNFFKDRHYIDKEFDIDGLMNLKQTKKDSDAKERFVMFEIGCAVGNTIFPIAKKYSDRLKVYGFDFSPRAINMIRENPDYDLEKMEVEVCDLVNDPIPVNFPLADFVTCIFIMCAISPENHVSCMKKLYDSMKSDSYLYFRDYGKYDMAQLKLAKSNRSKLKDNFYSKSDGTRCYYFDHESLEEIMKPVGFKTLEIDSKYRMVVNRKENKEMKRVWIQGLFYKD